MNFRKILCGVMASAMAVSMSANVFAAEIKDAETLNEGVEIEVTGTTKTATIELIVPTSASIVLNPYGLAVTLEEGGSPVNAQVISAVQHIRNNSELKVKVETVVTGTIEGGAEFVNTDVEDTETDKKVYLAFGMETAANTDGTGLAEDTPVKAVLATADTTEAKWEDTDAIVLGKKDAADSCLMFGFTGNATKNPTSGAWTSEDIVGATIAFSFALDNSAAAGGAGN